MVGCFAFHLGYCLLLLFMGESPNTEGIDMTEHELRIEDVKIGQLESMTQTHHRKINNIESTLSQTPDPKTLRDMEHTFKELSPHTDEIKEAAKHYSEMVSTVKQIEQKQIKRDAYMMVAYLVLVTAVQYAMRHL